MINTLSIREIESRANNIYEAIVVLGKRSRQINDEQKQLVHTEKEYDDEYDELGEDEVSLGTGEPYLRLPKPVEVSLDEFLSGKLRHDFANADEADGKDA